MAGDTERSVFAKVPGYYDIHLNGRGRAKNEILGRMLWEPGEVVSYNLREYQDWRARMVASQDQ